MRSRIRRTTSDVVICGAGIAGVSAAYHLSEHDPRLRIVIVEERAPLSLTSDKSTECYRNWWPDAAMVQLVNRSVHWLERWADETGNAFGLNRRGYLYASTTEVGARALLASAKTTAQLGAGPLRVVPIPTLPQDGAEHAGRQPEASDGADYCADPDAIQSANPYLSKDTRAVLHVRRAGWFRAHELGGWLLRRAEQAGVTRLTGRMTRVDLAGGGIDGIAVDTPNGVHRIATRLLVNAAGPFASEVSAWVGVELPLSWELHLKTAFRDQLRLIPRQAPLVILTDEQQLSWSEEERTLLRQSSDDLHLLGVLPGGAHLRPEGPVESDFCLLLWPYHPASVQPTFPITPDPAYAEIAMRGMSRLIPGLASYVGRMPSTTVDGGYYTRAPDNLPLIGPTSVRGYYLMAAFSGFGVMASPAAGELLARSVLGEGLPGFAEAFLLERFDSPDYREKLRQARQTGEL